MRSIYEQANMFFSNVHPFHDVWYFKTKAWNNYQNIYGEG